MKKVYENPTIEVIEYLSEMILESTIFDTHNNILDEVDGVHDWYGK